MVAPDRDINSRASHPSRQKTLDDVAWTNVDADDDGGLSLVPLDPEEERRRRRQRESLLPSDTAYEEDDLEEFEYVKLQFSLKHMIIGQAVIAVILGLVRIFAPGAMAGTLGIAAVILAIAISVFEPDDKRFNAAWWCLFVLYIISCAVAMAMG